MKLNREYDEITQSILYNDKFVILKNDNHHGTNKYDHSKRVSYLSFLIAKMFRANSKEAAKAGLLHDFFYGERTEKEENSYLNHPITSANNAKKYFCITENEEKIIKSHMYHHAICKKLTPFLTEKDKDYLKKYKPNSKESIIVCISDLLVSIFEVGTFKIRYSTSLYIIFLINIFRY